MKLAYLGPEGSYSYVAAKHYAPDGELIGMRSFRAIISDIEEGSIDEGILPIENSTEGAVTQVMDGLMNTKTTKIQGEIILRITHNLLSVADNENEIEYVVSHPQAIEQCREFFERYYPHITLLPCESSSTACKIAKEKGNKYGAIGNSWAGENNGLQVIKKSIQDNINNQTRFVVVGKKLTFPTGRDKTSISFSFNEDYPGSLFSILKEFADEKINLTRVESRPAKAELGKYIFYIDFQGHREDIHCKRVLSIIKEKTSKLKVFGSYPIGDTY